MVEKISLRERFLGLFMAINLIFANWTGSLFVSNWESYRDKLYNNLRDNGVSNIQIIGWLYNGIRNQLVYQTVNNPTTQTTGLNYFALKQAAENRGNFTTKELTNALTVLRNVEQGIKMGTIEEPISIEYILAEILWYGYKGAYSNVGFSIGKFTFWDTRHSERYKR